MMPKKKSEDITWNLKNEFSLVFVLLESGGEKST